MNQLFSPEAVRLDDHVWHIPEWLDQVAQRELAESCHRWGQQPAGRQRTQLPSKKWMSVETVCLGWHWYPYGYSRFVDRAKSERVKPFPAELQRLAARAIDDTYGRAGNFSPDTALLNFYDINATQGMHQDKDERVEAPVVSISLGATGNFRFGNTKNRNRPWQDVQLRSGDLFVFGGQRRYSYHGISKVLNNGSPVTQNGTRINITIRQVE